GQVRRREMLAQIDAYGFSGVAAPVEERPGLRELADRFAEKLGTAAMPRFGPKYERTLRDWLRQAGYYRTEPELFLGYRLAGAVLLPFLWIFIAVSAGTFGFRAVVAVFTVGGLLWVIPGFMLSRRAPGRPQQIDLEMPELVDLLVTT